MSNNKYERLMEPGYIGQVKTRNRIVKTGAGLGLWNDKETHTNPRMLSFYESLARGGVGLLIVESPIIDYPYGARWPDRYRIDQDKYIKGLSELVKVIHKYDCPTFMQMNHDGPWEVNLPISPVPMYKGKPMGASAVSVRAENDFHNEVPEPLKISQIEDLVDKFANAAERAKKAGFDGVDINAASSHLLHNFLSPFWNRRTDKYGGSLENRARIVTQIIQEIKRRLGKDFPIDVIINGMEVGQIVGIDNSTMLTKEDSQGIAKILESAGADSIHVRSHWLGFHVAAYLTDMLFYPEPPVPAKDFPKGYDASRMGAGANIPLAAGIKKGINIPVIVVGRMDADLGEKALKEGSVDFVGMTRRLQADPNYPQKIKEGRLDDIAPCTACACCLGSQRCRINPFLGKPYNTVEEAKTKKKVVVIGGGPSGMEAARTVALRGHDVSLYERSGKLGGLLPLAATVKSTDHEDLPLIIRYFKGQLSKLGVKLNLGKEVDASEISKMKPDAVIIAAGGLPTVPEIPGINRRNVVQGAAMHRMLKFFLKFFSPDMLNWITKHFMWATKLFMPIGDRIIIIGGEIQGCELAEFLVKRGKTVTIVEKSEAIGKGMVDAILGKLLYWFRQKGVVIYSGVKEYIEITAKGLTFIDKNGIRITIEADTIIPALPLTPNDSFVKSVKAGGAKVYSVGDCNDPALIADAIGTGHAVAREI